MIAKINQLQSQVEIAEVKELCESAISAISSAIYNGVTNEARLEIERVALNNLFEGLEKYAKENLTIAQWLTNQKRIYSVKNLGIRKAITTLFEKEAKYDFTLSAVLEDFRQRLEEIPEILLYEDFISAMSGFNHLPAVNTELNAVASRVDQYKNDVDITKIIETMKLTRSNYLIPLIEDVVDNYLNDKTEQTKSHLKETLIKFSYDPFIRDLINIVTLDATQLQLEYANAECDIEERLFSPIMYLGENEALFNVKGTYYIKKGNNVNKLQDEDVNKIDFNFKSLCETINSVGVEISRKDIKVFVGNDNAIITDSTVAINGKKISAQQLNESIQQTQWVGNTDFFYKVNTLSENFNEIAELDFVKRVYLKENENYAADVFKLRDNIFITTFDPFNNKTTFYRNINPIQAEKIMMEHMRFDVSKTFEDILPNKQKILLEIESTKKEYSSYIDELKEKIQSVAQYNENDTTLAVIQALSEELEEVQNDYKNYLNEVETFINVTENLNITVQDDQSGKSYTVVVPTGAMAAKGEQGTGGEGDSFGTEVGASSMPAPDGGGAASAVTFDDDQSELISDEPSDERDKVDLGADELEAYADKVDAEKDLEGGDEEKPASASMTAPETGGGEGGDLAGSDLGAETTPGAEGDELNLGDTGEETGGTELDLGTEEKGAEQPVEEPVEEPKKKEEGSEPPMTNLKKTNFNKDKNPDDLDEPKKVKKVYLKKQDKSKK